MKLWLFTFTQEKRTLLSARVVADTRGEACEVMGDVLGRSLNPMPYQHPEPGTILQAFGAMDSSHPHVVSVITA